MLAFDHFRWDPETGQWWDGEELVRLSPKAGAVLHYLVTHAGQLVSTADIRQAVWVNGGGSAAALKVCIGEIRKGLQDNARTPRFIETHPRQGYRFIAPLISSAPAAPSPVSAASPAQLLPTAWPSSSSLVGREAELGQLQQAFRQALQGERQLMFVSGEPGIGKTTLVNAFLSQLAAQSEAVWVTRGQCVEQYGAGEAYLPILEALGRLEREAEGAEITPVLAQYALTWLAQLPALVMPAEREALQQTLVGATRERMLREMAEALEVLTTRRPVVLVLEDLHWSDQSTLELLSYLLRRQGSARLLLLGTFRSTEVLGNDQPLRRIVQDVHGRNHGEEIQLGLLDEEQVHDYLRTQLRSKGALELSFHELAQWVHGRTEGNPLFMVTLVEQLQREGVLIETERAWQIGEAWDQRVSQVPDSLRQVIERQFESLSATEQQVLAVASVVGTEFAVAAVAAGSEQAIETVEEQCGELAARGHFIREAGIEEWPDGTLGGRYRFLHALYQNVLYDRVPEVRRVQLHRRIAERKAAAYGERVGEIAAELASHYEAGRELEQAIQCLGQASEQALRRNAHHEAIRHASKGLELLTTLPATPERAQHELALQVALGPGLMATKGWAAPELGNAYARARELCRQIGETPQLFPVLSSLAVFYRLRGEPQPAQELAAQVLRIAERVQDPALLVLAHRVCGSDLHWQGELVSARAHLEQGIALYDPQQHHTQTVQTMADSGIYCRGYAAVSLWPLGYPDQALQRASEALTLAREIAHATSLWAALTWALHVHQMRREVQAAAVQADTLVALTTESEVPDFFAWGVMFQGWARAQQGEGEEGIRLLHQGVTHFRATGMRVLIPLCLHLLAEAYQQVGSAQEGLAVVSEGLALIDKIGPHCNEAELRRLKGEFLLAEDSKGQSARSKAQTEAETCFQQALKIARKQEAKSWELRAAMSLGRLWQQQGKREEAREMVAEVYEWFTEGFDTKDLQEAEALLISLGGQVKSRPRPVPSSPVPPAPVEFSQPIPLSESQTATAPSDSPIPSIFRREGEYWTLVFAGQECRVKATRGMQYLAQLLCSPHQEFFAVTLASENTVGSEPALGGVGQGLATELDVQLGLSDAGDVLDAQAQAAYKQHVAELQAELEEAQAFNDEGRAEKLQGELEFLTQELAQALGLGGRSRKVASSTERARVNVTRAIRTAITRIEASHPPLGQYLQRTIKTGTACSYTPDSSPLISWQF